MTVRQEVLEVARDLTARGLVPFSPQQVIDELRLASDGGGHSRVRPAGIDRASASSVTTRTASPAETTGRPWSWQGNVQSVFADHLTGQGWEVTTTADTASREPGPDVVAHRDGIDLIVEVKGYPDSSRASVNTQARHYTAGALLSGLLAWGDHPHAHIGLVFPDATTYRNLLRRLRTPLEQLSISVWIVHENGRTETWLDGHTARR
ncbi:MAG: hypothetical protein ACLFV0_05660 [Nitriliruptoraceae bacterium]